MYGDGKNVRDWLYVEDHGEAVWDIINRGRRYAIDCTKLKQELGWRQRHTFEEGLARIVRWYLDNTEWVESIRTGAYKEWIEKNYGNRNWLRASADTCAARLRIPDISAVYIICNYR
mgnify:FL=1